MERRELSRSRESSKKPPEVPMITVQPSLDPLEKYRKWLLMSEIRDRHTIHDLGEASQLPVFVRLQPRDVVLDASLQGDCSLSGTWAQALLCFRG
jgi:hypothetical protein